MQNAMGISNKIRLNTKTKTKRERKQRQQLIIKRNDKYYRDLGNKCR